MEHGIEDILIRYPVNKKENLIPMLQEIQRVKGYLPGDCLSAVSEHLGIPLNKIYGVATFFDQFHFQKRGLNHILICEGTACHLNQSFALLREVEQVLKITAGQTTRDGKFSLEKVACLGTCANSPALSINGTFYAGLTKEKLQRILATF
jgi:NADH-quinone oxidoreductase subunit E